MRSARGQRACGGPRRRRAAPPARATWLLYLLLATVLLDEVSVVLASRDYYDVLGVSRDADGASIKRAFRKLARTHHPDKNPGDSKAEELYVELNTAYEVLADDKKRQRYDMYGEAGLEGGGGGGGGGGGWGDFGDFSDFFGGGGGGRGRREEQERRSPNFIMPLSVPLEVLYSGGVLEATHKRRTLCSRWDDCEKRCGQCGGSGVVITTRRIGPGFVQQVRSACPKCSGTGKISTKNCTACPQGQFEAAENTIMIDIEPGFPDGHRVVFEGHADEIPDHVPGDLAFEIDTQPHPVFRRAASNLHYDITISLTEALVGMDRAVRQLDGRLVRIKTSSVTVPDQVLVIPGEGMPNPDGSAGDLLVRVTVRFPETVSEDQAAAILKVHGDPPKTTIGNDGAAYEPENSTTGAAAGEDKAAKEDL